MSILRRLDLKYRQELWPMIWAKLLLLCCCECPGCTWTRASNSALKENPPASGWILPASSEENLWYISWFQMFFRTHCSQVIGLWPSVGSSILYRLCYTGKSHLCSVTRSFRDWSNHHMDISWKILGTFLNSRPIRTLNDPGIILESVGISLNSQDFHSEHEGPSPCWLYVKIRSLTSLKKNCFS